MRIAQICVHSCPQRPPGVQDVGGMNLLVNRVSSELNRMGVEIDIFTRKHDPAEPEIIMLNEKTRLIHIEAGEITDIPKINIYGHLNAFYENIKSFIERNRSSYDLLHGHYWLSGLVTGKLKYDLSIPEIVTFHTLGLVKNKALKNSDEPDLRIRGEKIVASSADKIIAFTSEEKSNLINLYGCQPEKIEIIPGGVDLDTFRPMDKKRARLELGIPNLNRIILFAGRIQPIKGLDTLLQALAHLPSEYNIGLIVVGGNAAGDKEFDRLNNLIKTLGIDSRVFFIGQVEHQKMPLYYNAADVFVVPSFHESFGLVALESLASGTPVIASSVGGLTTIVRDGENGFLVEQLSPDSLALHLCLLLSENGMRLFMSQKARRSVMKYEWTLIARQTLGFYRRTGLNN